MTDDRVSLREHFEHRFTELDRRFDIIEQHRIELRDLLRETVAETQRLLNEYKKDSNEWRGLANDVIANHPSKGELDGVVEKLELKMSLTQASVAEIKTAQTLQAGAKAQGIDIRTTVLGLIAAGASVAAIVLGIIAARGG